MPKRSISGDEWYPVFVLSDDDDDEDGVEIDEALIARYEAVMAEFEAVQKVLNKIDRNNQPPRDPVPEWDGQTSIEWAREMALQREARDRAYDPTDPLHRAIDQRISEALVGVDEDDDHRRESVVRRYDTQRRIATALRTGKGTIGYPSPDIVEVFGLIPVDAGSSVYTLPERLVLS